MAAALSCHGAAAYQRLHLTSHMESWRRGCRENKKISKVLNPLPCEITALTCNGAAASVCSICLRIEILCILGSKLVLDVTLPCNASFIHFYWRKAPSNVSTHLP